MALWVRFIDGQIVEGPLDGPQPSEDFVEYVEIVSVDPMALSITTTLDLIDGKCVKTVTGKKSYVIERAHAYPSYGNQFDMLWHAMDDGQIPKVEPFYSDIKAVKAKYPKPVQ
jgi:hypothetical protein